VRGVFQAARRAAASALVGGVEGQGYEALLGQVPRVQAGGLFLDAAAGVADDDGRARADVAVVERVVVGGVEVAGDLDAGAVEADVRAHGSSPIPGSVSGCAGVVRRLRGRALCRGPHTRFAPVPGPQKERVPARERGVGGRNLPPHRW
jgi:hypothetical protein